MKVISISTDRNMFEEGSAVRARQVEYGTLFEELHIVVFTTAISRKPSKVQIAPNVWVYGTNSLTKIFHIGRAKAVAARIIHERGFGVITVQDPFETGLVGVALKKKYKLPLHVQIHTDFLDKHFARESVLNRVRVMIAKRVLPHADAVRAVSQRIADSLKTQLTASSCKLGDTVSVQVLPIFVDINKIENTPVAPDGDLRKKYPYFNFIILMASRLTVEKNIPFAIEMFGKLHEKYPSAGLVIVGSGPEEKFLKSLVAKRGLSRVVVFEPWQHNLVSYYKTAHLFLLTSQYEGYGLTLAEAVASHCPTVSSDVGIARELLMNERTSSVCPVGDMNCFLDTVASLIENPGLREEMVHMADARLDRVIVFDKVQYLKSYRESIESARVVQA